MGLSFMGLNIFKKVAKMSLELLRLPLELHALINGASVSMAPRFFGFVFNFVIFLFA